MVYASCKYGPPPPTEVMSDAQQMIVCIDDAGTEWWLTEDCQVGDWLRFKEDGGEVTPYQPPQEPA